MGYLALRRAILDGPLPEVTCLLGTMVQEAYVTAPAIRGRRPRLHPRPRRPRRPATSRPPARSTPRTPPGMPRACRCTSRRFLQGSFILAKATGDVAVAQASLDHLAAYLRHLFHIDPSQEDRT